MTFYFHHPPLAQFPIRWKTNIIIVRQDIIHINSYFVFQLLQYICYNIIYILLSLSFYNCSEIAYISTHTSTNTSRIFVVADNWQIISIVAQTYYKPIAFHKMSTSLYFVSEYTITSSYITYTLPCWAYVIFDV